MAEGPFFLSDPDGTTIEFVEFPGVGGSGS